MSARAAPSFVWLKDASLFSPSVCFSAVRTSKVVSPRNVIATITLPEGGLTVMPASCVNVLPN